MLSDEARGRFPFAAFAAVVRETPAAELDAAREAFGDEPTCEVVSDITLASGEVLHRRWDGTTWRYGVEAVDLYRQDTPRRALWAFVRAAETRQWETLSRLQPQGEGEGLPAKELEMAWLAQPALDTRVKEIREALKLTPLDEAGAEAFFVYAPGRRVRLQKQSGMWRVVDF